MKKIFLPRRSASARFGIIHPDDPAFEFLAIEGSDHLWGGSGIDLDPAVHLLHIYLAEDFLLEVAHVEYELQETGLVKSVLRTEVDEELLEIAGRTF